MQRSDIIQTEIRSKAYLITLCVAGRLRNSCYAVMLFPTMGYISFDSFVNFDFPHFVTVKLCKYDISIDELVLFVEILNTRQKTHFLK